MRWLDYPNTLCEYKRYWLFWQERVPERRISIMCMPKTSAIWPQSSSDPLGKIEVLPTAVHSIAVQATSECYRVLGIASPQLCNGQAIILAPGRLNQGVRVAILNDQLIIDVYVALEYGLPITAIAHSVMSNMKYSIEKMLGVPVTQVNVNVQGLLHGPVSPD
jgi:uncharacterized alkaline shock family protein YloU